MKKPPQMPYNKEVREPFAERQQFYTTHGIIQRACAPHSVFLRELVHLLLIIFFIIKELPYLKLSWQEFVTALKVEAVLWD